METLCQALAVALRMIQAGAKDRACSYCDQGEFAKRETHKHPQGVGHLLLRAMAAMLWLPLTEKSVLFQASLLTPEPQPLHSFA